MRLPELPEAVSQGYEIDATTLERQAALDAIGAEVAACTRGALSGALKKQRGFTIVSSKPGSERVYKIGGAR